MASILKTKDDQGKSIPLKIKGKDVYAGNGIGTVVNKSVDKDNRIVRIVGTDETKDREGDIILISGWKNSKWDGFENFWKNPVGLWAHDYNGVPISTTRRIFRK